MLELGSGAGLCGLIMGNLASKTIISDYQEEIMKLMRKNVCAYRPEMPKELYYCKLDWDETKYEEIEVIDCEKMSEQEFEDLAITCEDDEVEDLMIRSKTNVSMKEFGPLDYVIGADIVYWSQSVDPLVRVLDELFTA